MLVHQSPALSPHVEFVSFSHTPKFISTSVAPRFSCTAKLRSVTLSSGHHSVAYR